MTIDHELTGPTRWQLMLVKAVACSIAASIIGYPAAAAFGLI